MSSPIVVPSAAPLFDDSAQDLVKNGASTRADIMRAIAQNVQHYQYAGRPLFHYWGGQLIANEHNLYRFLRYDVLEGGGGSVRSRHAILPPGAVTPTSTQGIRVDEDIAYDSFRGGGINNAVTTYAYPENTEEMEARGPTRTVNDGVLDFRVGPIDNASPYMMSGCFYEDAVYFADPSKTVLPDGFIPNAGIIATKTGARATDDVLRDRFQHVWKYRRPTIGWSARRPGGGGAINFTVSKNDYRFIFDQSIGDGGTAPSATGPAFTLPLRHSAAGLRNQIRVYVWVFACLSAGTGTGTLAVANLDSGGSMTAMTALTNNVAITGTTFQWWPATGASVFDPSTDPHFNGYAGGDYDRILLGAKTNGTASVKIGAYQMLVLHSTA